MRNPITTERIVERHIHIEQHRLITRRLWEKIRALEAIVAEQKQKIADLERDDDELRE